MLFIFIHHVRRCLILAVLLCFTNILLALLFVFISPKRPVKMKIFSSVYVVIFGIAGAVALLLQCRMEK